MYLPVDVGVVMGVSPPVRPPTPKQVQSQISYHNVLKYIFPITMLKYIFPRLHYIFATVVLHRHGNLPTTLLSKRRLCHQ